MLFECGRKRRCPSFLLLAEQAFSLPQNESPWKELSLIINWLIQQMYPKNLPTLEPEPVAQGIQRQIRLRPCPEPSDTPETHDTLRASWLNNIFLMANEACRHWVSRWPRWLSNRVMCHRCWDGSAHLLLSYTHVSLSPQCGVGLKSNLMFPISHPTSALHSPASFVDASLVRASHMTKPSIM